MAPKRPSQIGAPQREVQTTMNKQRSGGVVKAAPAKVTGTKKTSANATKWRMTSKLVIFGGGPLSNWNQGNPFPGNRALELMIERLDEAGVKHPPRTAISSRLLAQHSFLCGEQWMMAVKGWLFEADIEQPETSVEEDDFDEVVAAMHARSQPPVEEPENLRIYHSTLCKVLRTAAPAVQKKLGRECKNYDDRIWEKASVPAVVACSIARAEVNPDLKEIYIKSGERTFVEGSFRDRVWGVGLSWETKAIENKGKWRGTNRLGKCHDQARNFIRRSTEDAVTIS